MFEQEDEGTRIGLWVVIGVLLLVLFGVIGGVVLRQMHGKPGPAVMATAPAAVAADEALLDVPLEGDLLATLYFEIARADLPPEAQAEFAVVLQALGVAPSRKLVLAGFHDATGDPAFNAELAKQRAIVVREALVAAGAARERVLLRKPESTTGDGTNQEARRVEIRIVE